MTEKRFIIIGDSNIEYLMQSKLLLPIYDKKVRLNLTRCCDLLNEQYETIQQSKELIKTYYNENSDLIKENEQLKSKYSEQCIQLDFLKDENRHMKQVLEENEQLKQELQSILKLTKKIEDYTYDIKLIGDD